MEVSTLNLYRLLRFGIEGKLWEVISLEMRADGRKILHFFRENSSPVSGATGLEVTFQ
jgi:hypothetical protein